MSEDRSLLPPHDLDAEAAVLAGVILAPPLLLHVVDWLAAEHFYSEKHRRTYEAIVDLYRAGAHVDVGTVGSWLKERDRIAQVGGMAWLTELLNSAPVVSARSIGAYATTVHERWRARQLIARMQRLSAEAYQGVPDVQDFADGAVRGLEAIARKKPGQRAETTSEIIARLLREKAAPAEAGVKRGIPTGLASFDRLTGGLHAARKTVITARSGRGKTTLALQMALGAAAVGVGVQIFAMEQTAAELLGKLICGRADVALERWRDSALTPEDWRRVTAAASELGKLPIWIEYVPRARPSQIRNAAMLRADHAVTTSGAPLGLVIVDHIHEEAPETNLAGAKRQDQLAHAARVTKQLALDLRIPVVELAQMKDLEAQQGGRRGPVKPRLGCVSWCKDIEDTADNLAAIWEPDPKRREDVECVLLKVREGQRGAFPLRFRNERFFEPDAETSDRYDPMRAASRRFVDQAPPPPDSAPLPEPRGDER